MTLNLKSDTGLDLFYRMAKDADVILEGFRPGVVKRLGVDYESIKKINGRIVYCSISGFGQTGPLAQHPGHDINYISIAGLLDQIGEFDGPPIIPGVQIADIAGGSMNAAMGILLALLARERSGQGQYIDISMTDGVLGFLALPYFFSRVTGQQPERGNVMLAHRYGCYNTYETKDGRYLSIGGLEHRFWHTLCVHLQLEKFSALQYDEKRRTEIITTLREVFLKKDLSEWEDELANLDVCFAPVKSMSEVLDEPLFGEREMVHKYEGIDGSQEYGIGIPVKLSDTPGTIRTKPCQFGEHTREILAEFGYSDSEIEELVNQGTV